VFCSAEKFDLIFNLNSTIVNKADLQQRLCNMSDKQYEQLSNILQNSISDDELIQTVKVFILG
jgi:hypothetical protein